MNDSSHVFKGRHLDGVSCPICGGPVLPKSYDERKDSNLPYYRDLKKQSSKRKSAITIDLNFDDKSKLKLRAIAKHVGALADELDAIDNAWQCDCGSTEFVDFYSDSKVIRRECEKCSEQYAMNDKEAPTQPEGSD
jgi:Zn ribbon nucleic-acid-binding protein